MLTWNYRLEVRLPRTWLSLVDEIAWNYEEETVDSVMQKTIQLVAKVAACASTFASDKDAVLKLEASLLDTLELPDNGIGPDLLSPIPSRNPSPRRIRPKSKSPARWKILRSINDAIQDVLDSRTPGVHGASRYHVLLIMTLTVRKIQCPLPRIPVLVVTSNISTSTISAPSVCGGRWKRV